MGRYFKRIYSIIFQIYLMLFICISLSHAMPKKDSKDPISSAASGACKSTDVVTLQNDDYHDFSELCKRVEQVISEQKINLCKDRKPLELLCNHWFEIGMLLQIPHYSLDLIRAQYAWYGNGRCFEEVLRTLLSSNSAYSKEFFLSIALPCGGNNFNVAIAFMKKFGIEEHDAKPVLSFWMQEHPLKKKELKI